MADNIEHEIKALGRMTVGQLQARYAELFGERPPSRHRLWLVRRIAWRFQALAEGGLSERALKRAQELGQDADLRMLAPRSAKPAMAPLPAESSRRDAVTENRLPLAGTMLMRDYKGRSIAVKVLSDGFEFEGKPFKSLSAIAKRITGAHWNGFHFFGLRKPGATR